MGYVSDAFELMDQVRRGEKIVITPQFKIGDIVDYVDNEEPDYGTVVDVEYSDGLQYKVSWFDGTGDVNEDDWYTEVQLKLKD